MINILINNNLSLRYTGKKITLAGETLNFDIQSVPYEGLYDPKCWYKNGRTFFVTRRHYIQSDGRAFIFMYYNGVLSYQVMPSNPTNLNYHNNPVLMIDNDGYIYIFHEIHNNNVDIWKSNNPYDISEWTANKNVAIGVAYPKIYYTGSKFYALGRRSANYPIYGNESANGITWGTPYAVTVNGAPDTGFTDSRHYPYYIPNGYGIWNYLYFAKRQEFSEGVFNYKNMWCIKTQNFNTFYNLQETFNKAVKTEGALTEGELNINCKIWENTTVGYGAGAEYLHNENSIFFTGLWSQQENKYKAIKFNGTQLIEIENFNRSMLTGRKGLFNTIDLVNPNVKQRIFKNPGDIPQDTILMTEENGTFILTYPKNINEIPKGKKFAVFYGTRKNNDSDVVTANEKNDLILIEVYKT